MAGTEVDTFERAVHTAHVWVSAVADELGTDDCGYAYRVLRAWLQTLRDRLPVGSAADFAAQLPELLRGAFYEGWEPSKVPAKYGTEEYLLRFAHRARISTDDVPAAAGAVARAMEDRLDPGALATTAVVLPPALRDLVVGGTTDGDGPVTRSSAERRMAALEKRVAALGEAIDALAHQEG
jgi:uncharacterized protein (DUF2267 family)